MVRGSGPVVVVATQHVDDLARSETLPAFSVESDDGREQLLHGDGGVPGHRGCHAGVAVAARCGFLVEVAQQLDASAVDGLAEGEHRIEVAHLTAFEHLVALAGFDEAALGDDIAESVDHPRIRGQSVTAGATGLLVVTFDRPWQVEVGDEADIGFVDAHAEGDRGDHDDAVFAEESRLVLRAHLTGQPCVIGQSGDAASCQRFGQLVDTAAGQTVDDARVAGVFGGDEVQQL